MDSIVLELQSEAMDSDTKISDLLRKSIVIARKLGIKDFEDWGKQELNGYNNNTDKHPQYREIRATLQWLNESRGWCPVVSTNDDILDIIESVKLNESITELEQLVRSEKNYLYVSLTNKQQKMISELGDNGFTQFRLLFGKSQAQRIIDMVRNIILEWTLKLEEDGILGEGIRFSQKEKQEAEKQNYTVNNIQNNFHRNVSGLQVQQHTQNSTQTQVNEMDVEKVLTFISNLQEHLSQTGLSEDNQKNIEIEIKNIKKQLSKKKPKTKVVKESIQTIRSLLEGVASNFIAQALLSEISVFM